MRIRPTLFFLSFIFFAFSANAKHYVVIGDSITCGSFGTNLVEQLSGNGNSVTVYCTESSRPENWLAGTNPDGKRCRTFSTANRTKTPCNGNGRPFPLRQLLQLHKNSEVVVALGVNSMGPSATPAFREMAQVVNGLGNKCKWIGPPHSSPERLKKFEAEFYEDLSQKMRERETPENGTTRKTYCELLDSRRHTVLNQGGYVVDESGYHPTEDGGRHYALHMAPLIEGRDCPGDGSHGQQTSAPSTTPDRTR